MNTKLLELVKQSEIAIPKYWMNANHDLVLEYLVANGLPNNNDNTEFVLKFAKLIIQECLNKIETYEIPIGNGPAGELACEWTYDALKSIRDDIKETFGVDSIY